MSDKRAVPYQRGKALADEFGIAFFETSAKNNTNVDEVRGGHHWADGGGGRPAFPSLLCRWRRAPRCAALGTRRCLLGADAAAGKRSRQGRAVTLCGPVLMRWTWMLSPRSPLAPQVFTAIAKQVIQRLEEADAQHLQAAAAHQQATVSLGNPADGGAGRKSGGCC